MRGPGSHTSSTPAWDKKKKTKRGRLPEKPFFAVFLLAEDSFGVVRHLLAAAAAAHPHHAAIDHPHCLVDIDRLHMR
jgi:hypothetical protein